jgi:hypothetical protein
MFAGNAAFAGEAKVTFNNKTGADVYLALCWPKYESDAADSNAFMWKKGWFKIEPGKSRTLSQQGVRHTHEMGYYAKGKGKNGKTIYWAGTSENAALIGGIHPTESFNTSECGFEGSVDVRFRKIDLKENGDNFAATVNLSN